MCLFYFHIHLLVLLGNKILRLCFLEQDNRVRISLNLLFVGYVYLSSDFPLNLKIHKNALELFILSIFMIVTLFNL